MKKPEWLPDWFDLKNYDSVASMGIKEWTEALQLRNYIASTGRGKYRDDPDEAIERLIRAAKNPSGGWGGEGVEIHESWRWRTVSPLEVGMIGLVWGEITSKGDGRKFKRDLEIGRIQKNPELAEKYSSLENSTYDDLFTVGFTPEEFGGFTFAQIDITASDEHLIEDFKMWLKDTRALIKIEAQPHKFTETDMADWHTKRVLPYIDLTVWAKLKGVDITQQEIGIVLFPDDFNISLSDRVRRTVKPLAEKLLKFSTVGAISAQAGIPYY